MLTEPTEQEDQWIGRWLALINKMPAPLLLMTDADATDTPVLVVLAGAGPRKAHHTRWINRFSAHLDALPDGDGWLLANVDGWHFGKGDPTITSSSSYGVNGACSSNSDDYAAHYVESVMVPYGAIPDGYQCLAELNSDKGTREAHLINKG